MTDSPDKKDKKKFTYVRPPVDFTDPNLTEEEIQAAIEEMSKGFIETIFGKQDWEKVYKILDQEKEEKE